MRGKAIVMTGMFGAALALAATAAVAQPGARPVRYGLNGPELDRLGPGRKVWICEEVGGWAGIVYGPRASTGCNVESPLPRVRAYRGPCRAGWVSSRYVTPIAG